MEEFEKILSIFHSGLSVERILNFKTIIIIILLHGESIEACIGKGAGVMLE